MSRRPAGPIRMGGGVEVSGYVGDTVLDSLLDANVELPHECGGNCACTTCMIEVSTGMANLSGMEPPEDERLDSAEHRTLHSRLACQAILMGGPISIRVVQED